MGNKNDALHLKKINSEVQPDNVNYATIRVDELGRVVYNDENGEKIVAYTEDAIADLFVDERVLVGEYDEINEIGNRTEILDNKIIFREGIAPFTDRVIFSVDYNNTEIIKYEINEDIEQIVSVTKDLVVETLSGNNGEIVTLDANGKLLASGTTVADLSGGNNILSVFEPFVISSTPEIVNTGSQYYTEIQQSYGNLIAIDADVGTYEEIDIRISTEWTTSQVGTFRLDLDVKSGQTFTFDSSIEGIADVTLPDISGAASLLFDKPYGSSNWYVRQNI